MAKCSVCIATYNGGNYIIPQLESILKELTEEDEIIVIDDCSTDNTVQLINGLNDNRVNLIINEMNMGHVFSFAKSIAHSNKDIIFLSDQDDIWLSKRKEKMSRTLEQSNALVLSSNFLVVDCNGQNPVEFGLKLKTKDSSNYIGNIFGIILGNRSYFGCAMAFRSELKKIILPVPKFVESHDLWIALAGNLLRKNIHLETVTLLRRIHAKNLTTSKRPLILKIKSRVIHLRSILVILFRLMFFKLK